MLFKFWKWRISIKIKNLDPDKKIGFLANALISAMQEAGNQVALPDIAEGFASVDIRVHRAGTKDVVGYVGYQSGTKHVNFTPDFGELKIFKED
jgi:hypothetical protein